MINVAFCSGGILGDDFSRISYHDRIVGTSVLRYEFGAISTLFPIFILPTITAFYLIQTSFPISGTPSFLPRLACAMVTPCAMLQFLPILVFGLMTTVPQCPK